jgi:hypothetical protein
MTNTDTVLKEQTFYTVKQLSAALSQRGIPLSVFSIHKYIKTGKIEATRDLLRPNIWVISHKELLRLVNQGQ